MTIRRRSKPLRLYSRPVFYAKARAVILAETVCRAAKVEQGVHPDLMIVDEGEAELKVDLARQLKAENAIIPNDGERRVTVIHHAQNLNPMAQNALLKELEEPPAYAFFIPDRRAAGFAAADRALALH